jgi:lipopolysaccharide biosynthesis glycosyltransferase
MNVMKNFLYCLDENYNYQLSVSIYSLLQNMNQPISIFIIHKTNTDPSFLPRKVLNHKNLESINIFKFNKNVKNFPNLNNSHVSEATYYRLFMDDYLPETLSKIIYLDADVVCVKNPSNEIIKTFENMSKNKKTIGVKTEIFKDTESRDLFNNLNMKSNNYFNAGVMFIDLKMWKKEKAYVSLRELLFELYEKVRFWDQDILNSFFDGNYYECSESLNKVLNLFYNCDLEKGYTVKALKKENIFIHYAGSHKPWTSTGVLSLTSEIYQELFRELFNKKYHLTHKWKVNSIKTIFNSIKDKTYLNLNFKISFLLIFIKSLFVNKLIYKEKRV